MTTLFIITACLLAVSFYFNWRLWETARYWQEKYIREKRGHMIDNLLSGIACGVAIFASWLSIKKE